MTHKYHAKRGKGLTRALAFLLTAMLVCGLAAPAYAQTEGPLTITQGTTVKAPVTEGSVFESLPDGLTYNKEDTTLTAAKSCAPGTYTLDYTYETTDDSGEPKANTGELKVEVVASEVEPFSDDNVSTGDGQTPSDDVPTGDGQTPSDDIPTGDGQTPSDDVNTGDTQDTTTEGGAEVPLSLVDQYRAKIDAQVKAFQNKELDAGSLKAGLDALVTELNVDYIAEKLTAEEFNILNDYITKNMPEGSVNNGNDGEDGTPAPAPEAPSEAPSLYDQLMAAQSCKEMFDLMNGDMEANGGSGLFALDRTQLEAWQDKLSAMEDDGFMEELQGSLESLFDGLECTCGTQTDVHEPWCGKSNDQTTYPSDYRLSMSDYRPASVIYWDVSQGKQKGDSSRVTSVELNGIAVKWSDSTTKGSNLSGGSALNTYYPGVTQNGTSIEKTLKIYPAEGYYVSKITVACVDSKSANAYNCNTWAGNKAYTEGFTVKDYVETQLPCISFGHGSRASWYFILIEVLPIPTPSFVEYSYGDIAKMGLNANGTVFGDPDGWTTKNEQNNYGTTNAPDTADTQFRYTYNQNKPAESANWKHYANSVTTAALNLAAENGYYFAGWKAEYYEHCSDRNLNTPDGNGYTHQYTMTGKYNSDSTFMPGNDVKIFMNVRLIAQWKPIELKVTKKVEGLISPFTSENHTYKIQVQKLEGENWEDYKEPLVFTIKGNGSLTNTLSPIKPGTYRAVEIEGNGNLQNTTTIMHITVSQDGQVTYTKNDHSTKELTVTNSYSDTPANATVKVQKLVSGGMGDKNKPFTFKVWVTVGSEYPEFTIGEDKVTSALNTPATFQLSHTGEAILTVPSGAKVTVIEEDCSGDGYTTTNTASSGNGITAILDSVTGDDNPIIFTNTKDPTPDTGVILDSLPYILILGVVVLGAVVVLGRKRRRWDD